MSEKYDKEKQPDFLTDECSGCGETYEITEHNGIIVHHSEQPECDYINCTCTSCGHVTYLFISDKTFEQGVNTGLPLEVNKYADERTYGWWTSVQGIELPKTYELTDRHEALIQKFGENILAIPDELFWENIEAETSHPYPNRWAE